MSKPSVVGSLACSAAIQGLQRQSTLWTSTCCVLQLGWPCISLSSLYNQCLTQSAVPHAWMLMNFDITCVSCSVGITWSVWCVDQVGNWHYHGALYLHFKVPHHLVTCTVCMQSITARLHDLHWSRWVPKLLCTNLSLYAVHSPHNFAMILPYLTYF